MRVVVSVYDKTGLDRLAGRLVELGHELVASGGTSAHLEKLGVPHLSVEEVTGAPEVLGGRVKTLHPALLAGVLADLGESSHREDLERLGVTPVGMVVCNLYPFSSRPSVELIDIGGPTMVRAAAKNWAWVASVVDPGDYPRVLAELESSPNLPEGLRRELAAKAFAHVAAYDAAIANWFAWSEESLPQTWSLTLERVRTLRYGENPHQRGALYRESGTTGWLEGAIQHGGRELSYLNLYDADAAWTLAHRLAELGDQAAVVVKHANPCGAAVASDALEAYQKAFSCDPMSAFGGIVALTGPVGAELAQAIVANPQADVLIAPSYDPAALEVFAARRKNMRVLECPPPGPTGLHLRQLSGAWLAQDPYRVSGGRDGWRVVTTAQPTEQNWQDMELAWRVCASVRSNAIVLAANSMAVGIGGGQQNRVSAAELATARAAGRAKGGAAASDAFFPFRDGLDACAAAGVSAVVQPGGSVNDKQVIEAADEHGLVMVFTGERQFIH